METRPPEDAPNGWGLLDTQDNVWLGNEKGPRVFQPHEHDLAMVAHTVVCIQLGWHGSRVRVAPFTGYGAKRDEINTKMTSLEALRAAEGYNDGT